MNIAFIMLPQKIKAKHEKAKTIYKIIIAIILFFVVLVAVYFMVISRRTEPVEKTPALPSVQVENSSDYRLVIDEIGVSAPIIINVDGNNEQEYDESLESGVAHLRGSALPGESGNVFIFAHSSYYEDRPGNYKQVFAKLNDLKLGDKLKIESQAEDYLYTVTDKKIVEADDVHIADQSYNYKRLTLMTCWPIGSAEQRLVVVGELDR